MNYDPQKIEKKWQRIWERQKFYQAADFSKKKKAYILVEFPYPSGEGLHVGHIRSYTAMDIISRKRRMEGYNVLYPIGWDAFGLPTENYAVKTGIHPKIVTKKNTDTFRRQLKSLGFSFDWTREINTTDPKYYKWTQWIFLQFYKKGLAYKKKMPINWCLSCKIGLADEEVVQGKCERCGGKVETREKEQWLLAITKYADRLLKDLDKVDYWEKIKIQQKNWIGKSEGAQIRFQIQSGKSKIGDIEVFTTRPDTLFGTTFMVVAPEHPLLQNYKLQTEFPKEAKVKMRTKFSSPITNYKQVEEYVKKAKKKTEEERKEFKDKTGIEIKGIKAINPVNKKEIPIFVADYVLLGYGTGAIMAVPAHDQRDWEFAQKFNLEIKMVICPNYPEKTCPVLKQAYEGEGYLVGSGKLDGMPSEKAKGEITKFVGGKKQSHYHIRDWIFSRQRYWGEPIPLVFCENEKKWVPLPEKDLPVKLPEVKNFKPTDIGESPLAKVASWVKTKCPSCKGPARRETDTMPNWAGSSWYYLAYPLGNQKSKNELPKEARGKMRMESSSPIKNQKYWNTKLLKYWTPVDWYNGGMEHTTLHLLYSRFWNKFLYDIGVVPVSEPYKKRTSHGIILGEGGEKMSKSRGNVVNPDSLVKEFGADSVRIYEMFMGPFDQMIAWDSKGVKGASRFLEKIWKLSKDYLKSLKPSGSQNLKKLLHKTIKKVTQDIENLKFNTAVSSLMEFSNNWLKDKQGLGKKDFEDFLKILAPFAPHLAEELWSYSRASENKSFGIKDSIHYQPWPKYGSELLKEETIVLVIQINGKVRDKVEVKSGISEKEVRELALTRDKVKKWTGAGKIKKIIFVPGKLINIVV